jgi:hypothetical protein
MSAGTSKSTVFLIGIAAALLAVTSLTIEIRSQQIVDKIVATVNDGVKTELITLSDLRWQLALQPGVQISPASSEDLNRALKTLIDQRLFGLEAERIPGREPDDAAIANEIKETLSYFPSTADFENRLRMVGFDSVKDPNFERMMELRVRIKYYLDFRFRSFVVITPDDERNYYRDRFIPDFRRRFPGVVLPAFEERRKQINETLTEEKVAANIESFLDEAKRRAEIVVLSEV